MIKLLETTDGNTHFRDYPGSYWLKNDRHADPCKYPNHSDQHLSPAGAADLPVPGQDGFSVKSSRPRTRGIAR
jgi:hypothetical protein